MADNLVSKVARLHQEERQSSKTHKPYYMLIIEFQNGYVFETFLNNDLLANINLNIQVLQLINNYCSNFVLAT